LVLCAIVVEHSGLSEDINALLAKGRESATERWFHQPMHPDYQVEQSDNNNTSM
jgi:hypothetical protein